MKILFIVMLLVSCGNDFTGIDNTTTFEELDLGDFKPYVQMFVMEAETQGRLVRPHGIEIKFAELEAPVVGTCYTYTNALPRIEVDPSWNDMDVVRRIALIYHELGHCLLGRGHTSDFSLMQPVLLSSETILDNEDELFAELFSLKASLQNLTIESDFCRGTHQ